LHQVRSLVDAERWSLIGDARTVRPNVYLIYRHFANKEALTQHLCAQLYARFTSKMYREMATANDPWSQLRVFVGALIRFALSYPDHYSLIFLMRHSNSAVTSERELLGKEFLEKIHQLFRVLFPLNTEDNEIHCLLRQIMLAYTGQRRCLLLILLYME
jgi:AcrR family transcriptional regulator